MCAAAFGFLTPVAGALLQRSIDIAVIVNALRALGDGESSVNVGCDDLERSAFVMKIISEPCGADRTRGPAANDRFAHQWRQRDNLNENLVSQRLIYIMQPSVDYP
jgi:hypothetical protein